MIRKLNVEAALTAIDTTGAAMQRWTANRRYSAYRKPFDNLGALDGIRFGVKLVVGLGPETRFRMEWWHRLVAKMESTGQTRVVLGRDQIEWLVEQVEPQPAQ